MVTNQNFGILIWCGSGKVLLFDFICMFPYLCWNSHFDYILFIWVKIFMAITLNTLSDKYLISLLLRYDSGVVSLFYFCLKHWPLLLHFFSWLYVGFSALRKYSHLCQSSQCGLRMWSLSSRLALTLCCFSNLCHGPRCLLCCYNSQ